MKMLTTLRSVLVGPALCAIPVGLTFVINGCFHPDADADSKADKDKSAKLGEVRSAYEEETEQVVTNAETTTTFCYCVVLHEGEVFPANDGWVTVPIAGEGPSNICNGVLFGLPKTGTIQCGPEW